jgi:condensation enzyme
MAEASVRMPAAASAAGGQSGAARDRIPLSFQQEFLKVVDHGDGMGPFGPLYTIVGGWRLNGELDLPALQGALDDVVARHEALHTRIVPDDGEPYQYVLPPAPPRLEVRDLETPDPAARDLRAEHFVNEIEAGTFDLHEVPLLRGVLGRFDSRDAVLALAAHHTAVDGWSVHLVVRDLAEFYAARLEGRGADLPRARQYREYVAWQRAAADSPAAGAARAYWRENLRGAQVVTIPTDRSREAGQRFVTGWYRFLIEDQLRSATLALADRMRSSPFMVLLAAYLVYLRETTGRTDLVVPTFTPGRSPAWVDDIVGSFYNLLPLRVDIGGCAGFGDVIARTRAACLAAYPREMPFMQLADEAPELMSPALEPDAALCVFQVTQSPHVVRGEQVGGLRYTAMRRRVVSAPAGSQIPDGVLLGLEVHPSALIGSVGYTTNLFDERRVAAMAARFTDVLASQLASVGRKPDRP